MIDTLGMIEQPKNSEEVTDRTVPDPDVLPRVCGDYLLVRPVDTTPEKTKGGIILASSIQDDVKYLHNVGRILSFGPRAYKTKEGKIVDWVEGGLKVGDFIQWERFVGKRMKYKGVNLVLLKDVAVQLVLENPEDVDSIAAIES
jgi:co-chaperonin GroES (HSP10)